MIDAFELTCLGENFLNNENDINLYNAINSLDTEIRSFNFFNIDLSESENECISEIEVYKSCSQDFDSMKDLKNQGKNFLETVIKYSTKNKRCYETLMRFIKNTAQSLLDVSGFKDVRTSIRGEKQTTEYDFEWHTDGGDGNDWINKNIIATPAYSFIFTLLGASTQFYNQTTEKDEFDMINYELTPNDKFTTSRIFTPETGQGTVFLTGEKYGAVHTTPITKNQRFIMRLVPIYKSPSPQPYIAHNSYQYQGITCKE